MYELDQFHMRVRRKLTVWVSVQICSLATAETVLVIRLCAICMLFSVLSVHTLIIYVPDEHNKVKGVQFKIWSNPLMSCLID